MSDLYVSGLDLSTGRVVLADEREVWEWHKKGHNGDRTLVCLECFHGADSPDGAQRLVPLVPRGRIGGVRQRHFAHPPGMAPAGGHSPETAWHWQTKHRLCRWVEKATGASARTEAWTAQGKRRSDVAVTFPDGARLAIEVQFGQITDNELLARRDDYIARGLANCDTGLASYLGMTQRNHDSRQKALLYWVDRMTCNGRPGGNTTPMADDPQAQAYLDGLVINHWRD